MGNFLKNLAGVQFEDMIKQAAIASAFMFLIKVTRCTIKTYTTNEFNDEVKYQDGESYKEMLSICKFCQIIANKTSLTYEDDQVAVFKDIRPEAKQHLLIVPKDHIKDVGTLKPYHAPLLKNMHDVAI